MDMDIDSLIVRDTFKVVPMKSTNVKYVFTLIQT